MRRAFYFWFVFFVLTFGYHITYRQRFRDGYLHVCRLVSREFYRDDDETRRWVAQCFKEGNRIRPWLNRRLIFHYLSQRMREIAISHFHLEYPKVSRATYLSRGIGTGIWSRYVDGRLIVYRLTKASSAEQAGLKVGDEIVQIPGIEEVSPRSATFRTGIYHFLRHGKLHQVEIRGLATLEDQGMTVETLSNGTRVLNIRSFLEENVGRDEVERVGRAIAGAPRVVIDLRENGGGSIDGVQRMLALFVPADRPVGALVSRPSMPWAVDIPEELLDWGYTAVVPRTPRLELRVAKGYPMYEGPVTVLIETATASAAEVFADAMRRRPNTRLWGWDTAGAVMMGVTRPIPEFGFGFAVVIPFATMLTAEGINLEGHPVRPDRVLFYEIEASLRGEDNWITEAAR